MTRKRVQSGGAQPAKSIGVRIIEGLTELRDALRSGMPLEKRFTVRTVEVPEPEAFDAQRVRALRARLQMSQPVFARLLGVSTILCQSWEQGVREPSPLARRLLGEMEREPDRWKGMILSVPTHLPRRTRKSA